MVLFDIDLISNQFIILTIPINFFIEQIHVVKTILSITFNISSITNKNMMFDLSNAILHFNISLPTHKTSNRRHHLPSHVKILRINNLIQQNHIMILHKLLVCHPLQYIFNIIISVKTMTEYNRFSFLHHSNNNCNIL